MPDYQAQFEALLKDQQALALPIAVSKHLAQVALFELTGLDALYPDFREKIVQLIANMNTLGKPVKMFEGFRTAKRQNDLFIQLPSVTDAKALQSWHQMCFAADLIFVNYNWNPPNDSWWTVLGTEAEKLGLQWGGRFVNSNGPAPDKPHIQVKEYGDTPPLNLQNYFML